MPGTPAELETWALALLDSRVMPDDQPDWADGTRPSDAEKETIIARILQVAAERRQAWEEARKVSSRARARALLESLLTPDQRAELARKQRFTVFAPSGRIYRFYPTMGLIRELEQHGTRLFEVAGVCLHPLHPQLFPPADVTITQLLCLSADEELFRQEANITPRGSRDMWNGDYMRQMGVIRRARQALAARDPMGIDRLRLQIDRGEASLGWFHRELGADPVPDDPPVLVELKVRYRTAEARRLEGAGR